MFLSFFCIASEYQPLCNNQLFGGFAPPAAWQTSAVFFIVFTAWESPQSVALLFGNRGIYAQEVTVASYHLWASKSTNLSFAVFLILRNTSQRYSIGSKLCLRILAKWDIRRTKRTPDSRLPLVLNLGHSPLHKHFCKCPHVGALTLYYI